MGSLLTGIRGVLIKVMNETHALPPGESHRPIQERAENAIIQLITTRLTSEEAVRAGAAELAGVSPSMVSDVQHELWMREARTVIQAAIGRVTDA